MQLFARCLSYLFCNFNPVIRNVEKWSVWTPQDFYSMFGHFSTCMKRLRHFQVQTSTSNLRDFEEKKKKSLHVVLSFHSLQIWLRFKKEFRFHKLKNTEILSSLLKARIQCFSKKFRQKKFFFFLIFLFLLKTSFQRKFSCFKTLIGRFRNLRNHCHKSAWYFTHNFTSNNNT